MSELLLKMPAPYEPKLKNRWLIKFKGDYKEIPSWSLSKTSRPKWDCITPPEGINNANSWNYMGGAKWNDIEIELRDPVDISTTKILMNAARLAGSSSVKYPKNKIKYDLELLDPTGVVVERWKIKGKVKSFDFGDLDYSKDELLLIKLIVEPIKVTLDL